MPLCSLPATYWVKKLHPIQYDWQKLAGMALLAALFYFVGMALSPTSLALKLSLRTILLVIYTKACIWLFLPELKKALHR